MAEEPDEDGIYEAFNEIWDRIEFDPVRDEIRAGQYIWADGRLYAGLEGLKEFAEKYGIEFHAGNEKA